MTQIGGLRWQVDENRMSLLSRAAEKLGSASEGPSFSERLGEGLSDVARAQSEASKLATDYELGIEQDLAKVMISQQVSSVGFQLALSLRNKALSAYKDIMNMPV
jgi:flagellar hook-basal body complex protein FliE